MEKFSSRQWFPQIDGKTARLFPTLCDVCMLCCMSVSVDLLVSSLVTVSSDGMIEFEPLTSNPLNELLNRVTDSRNAEREWRGFSFNFNFAVPFEGNLRRAEIFICSNVAVDRHKQFQSMHEFAQL